MSSCSSLLKVVYKALMLVGVLGFLILGAAATANINGGKRMKIHGDVTAGNNMKHRPRYRHHHRAEGNHYRVQKLHWAGSKSDPINYMSNKRKVPNGPDPIHNRRAGNSRQPPGQA